MCNVTIFIFNSNCRQKRNKIKFKQKTDYQVNLTITRQVNQKKKNVKSTESN